MDRAAGARRSQWLEYSQSVSSVVPVPERPSIRVKAEKRCIQAGRGRTGPATDCRRITEEDHMRKLSGKNLSPCMGEILRSS
jgi:hypothetical protein